MTPARSKQIVLVSTVALMAIAVYREQQNRDDTGLFKRVWGTGVLAVMLSIMADFAPQVAGPFAGLVVLGSLTHGGDRALVNLTSGASSAAGKVVPAGTTQRGGDPRTGSGWAQSTAPSQSSRQQPSHRTT